MEFNIIPRENWADYVNKNENYWQHQYTNNIIHNFDRNYLTLDELERLKKSFEIFNSDIYKLYGNWSSSFVEYPLPPRKTELPLSEYADYI